jgi:transcription elongation GreA/GreB family factor
LLSLCGLTFAPPARAQAALEAQASEDATRSALDVYGDWDADFDTMIERQELTDEERATAQTMMQDAWMRLTFGDGSVSVVAIIVGEKETDAGTWTLLEADDESLVIRALTGVPPQDDVMTLVFEGDDNFTISDAEGEEIPFVRSVEAE